MANTPQNEDDIIDLTGAPEPINPLVAPSSPLSRESHIPSSNEISLLGDDPSPDLDFEIVDVQRKKRRLRRVPPKSPSATRTNYNNKQDFFQVVSEKPVTPEEKLLRIREKHNKGEVVKVRPQSTPASRLGRGYRMSHRSNSNMPSFMRFMFDYEQQIAESDFARSIQNALSRSMEEQHNRKGVNLDKIRKPPPPKEARPGFTRSLDVSEDLVCIVCGGNLGEEKEGEIEENKNLSSRVFVRGCGHVYCGVCTYALKTLPSSKRGCPVKECRTDYSAHKRKQFREVFL